MENIVVLKFWKCFTNNTQAASPRNL